MNSGESPAVTADDVLPPTPTALAVTSGGPETSTLRCTIPSGTRFINNAGRVNVQMTAMLASPDASDSIVFTATTPGSAVLTQAVPAAATSVATTFDLSALLDGAVTLTAHRMDPAGNLSATKAPPNVVIKDVVAGALSGLSYTDVVSALGARDRIGGTSECGATIIAVQTAGGSTTYTSPPLTSSPFSLDVTAQILSAYSYNVTATDLAGNKSAITVVSGNAVL